MKYISKNHKFVITIEEGALIGGFGSMVNQYLSSYQIKIISMGIPDNYIEHGTRQELLDEVGLNFEGVIDSIDKIKNEK